ncbi:MAG: hypothetical protein KAR64_02175 [Thermoplasmatales archaeon]|nr:hypothetical protein [Thermoplasmatales archaeon]
MSMTLLLRLMKLYVNNNLAHRIVVLIQSIKFYNIKANLGKLNMNYMPVADNKVSNHIILRRHMQLKSTPRKLVDF